MASYILCAAAGFLSGILFHAAKGKRRHGAGNRPQEEPEDIRISADRESLRHRN